MALFGRRKPGFSKEVEMHPEDIPGEFSDRNDPAMQRGDDNPKAEKIEMQRYAQSVIEGNPENSSALDLAQQAAAEGKKVDLFDYIDSLPDVPDPFPPSEDATQPEPDPEPVPEQKPGEVLAEYIRERSRAAQLTAKKPLLDEEPELDVMISEMRELDSCKDIENVQGAKDEYFFSSEIMARNYAMIAMLVEEKDLSRTIAQMVRFNCKTYPAPTPLYYFMRSPYNYTKPQLDHALAMIRRREDMKDIQAVTAFNGVLYLYSEEIMSRKYAQALANGSEEQEGDN